MKIAIVCPYDYYGHGGVQIHIHDCAYALRNMGHTVKIIAPAASKQSNDDTDLILLGSCRKIRFNQTEFDISIIRSNEKKKLENILKNEKFDIMHFHTIWSPLLPLQVLCLSNCARVGTFHDTPPDNWVGKITRGVFYLLSLVFLRYLDEVIAVSEAPLKHLARITGKHIHILPPCTNLDIFSPNAKPLKSYSDNRVNILFLGRLDKRKGLLILLRAYQKLLGDNLKVRLLIAGQGMEFDNIRRLIQAENIPYVEMLGHIQESDKPACYASCDIFCAPAPCGESFGIVLVEAMASGKPVIAAANAGYSKILSEMSDFCLVQPHNVDSLYIKLKNLIQDTTLQNKLGEWGIKEAKKYNSGALIDKYLQIYQNALLLKS